MAFLLVIDPVAHVVVAVLVDVGAIALGFVVDPLAVVHVAVPVNESPDPVGHVVEPVAVIARPVRPQLHSLAAALAVLVPLPLVHAAIAQLGRLFVLQLETQAVLGELILVNAEVEGAQSVLHVDDGLVAAVRQFL